MPIDESIEAREKRRKDPATWETRPDTSPITDAKAYHHGPEILVPKSNSTVLDVPTVVTLVDLTVYRCLLVCEGYLESISLIGGC